MYTGLSSVSTAQAEAAAAAALAAQQRNVSHNGTALGGAGTHNLTSKARAGMHAQDRQAMGSPRLTCAQMQVIAALANATAAASDRGQRALLHSQGI